MKRENTNKIRFVLEDILPPIIRDSFIFKLIIKRLYRSDETHLNLKSKILNISRKEYENYYKHMPKIHDDSDLSISCINEIIKNIEPKNVIDVGCGNGFLLKKIRKNNKKIILNGSEITITSKLKVDFQNNNIKLYRKSIENIHRIKNKFDTVICSHVLEHVLDINKAYYNLKKICKKKLIIIVPRERPYKYTFNGHIHFFPYKWSFINTIRPKNKFTIKDLQRDFLYIENIRK